MTEPADGPWVETLATVTACRYQFGGLGTMAFGIPDINHFLITFTYTVAGRTLSSRFKSPKAIAQGETFPITYNPLAPEQNSKSSPRF